MPSHMCGFSVADSRTYAELGQLIFDIKRQASDVGDHLMGQAKGLSFA